MKIQLIFLSKHKILLWEIAVSSVIKLLNYCYIASLSLQSTDGSNFGPQGNTLGKKTMLLARTYYVALEAEIKKIS